MTVRSPHAHRWMTVGCLLACLAPAARAGEVVALLGQTWLDEGAADLDDSSATRAAVSVTVSVTPRLSVGGELAASWTEKGDDVWLPSALAIAEWQFRPEASVRPLVRVGAGAAHVRGVTAGVKHDAGDMAAGQLEAGVAIGGDRWALRLTGGALVTDGAGTHPHAGVGVGWRF